MPATHQQISEFLASSQWTESEKWVIQWQFGLLGEFESALAECIKRADEANLSRLSLGFPEQVVGFISWSRGHLGQRLRNAGLGI